MRLRLAALAVLISTGTAMADGTAPPAPGQAPPVPTTAAPPMATVQLSMVDLQVAIIAIANAGAACDQQVKPYCQLTGARDAVMTKLNSAFQDLQKPAAPTPDPAPKKK